MNTVHKGDALETRIHDLFAAEIAADRFWAKQSCCRIFRKKGYFSKDRGANIIFDLSIEIYLPGAPHYSPLVLIECKNYTHSVPVDDAEEFFAKVQQITMAKGVIASTAAFQSGTLAFAKSKGIALLRYFEPSKSKWELYRSPSTAVRSISREQARLAEEGLSQPGFRSTVFDLYFQLPTRATTSVWDFFDELVIAPEAHSTIRQASNPRSKLANQVPYLEKDTLESLSSEILTSIGYSDGEVSLDAICAREKERAGLSIRLEVDPSASQLSGEILGCLAFDPLEIVVFKQALPNRGRERFTLAHELAHHLLSHGDFLFRDSCEETDFDASLLGLVEGTDLARLEFQANFLASCLLMPQARIRNDFRWLTRKLNIPNKGFGELYVDDQICNRQTYEIVTNELMQCYGVSRSALSIRLAGLRLLHDARTVFVPPLTTK
jgi:Zn-dependent peptidase ImmA (M78 family)